MTISNFKKRKQMSDARYGHGPYVDPRICAHRRTAFTRLKTSKGKNLMWAFCDVCQLQGPPIRVGWFEWWARSRASRAFYKTALQVDKEKT
jgi:hypothetical protein